LKNIEKENYFTKYYETQCIIKEDDFKVMTPSDDPIREEFSTFINEISDNKSDRAEAIGRIQVFKRDDAAIKVSIPIGDVHIEGQNQSVDVILFSIDLNGFQNTITTIGLCSLFIFALIISLLFYLYGVTIKRAREFEQAFEQVDLVMYKSPIPYVRLDESDRIKDSNASFREIFGYEVAKKNSMNGITFRSLCAGSKDYENYDRAQAQRKMHQQVEPYILNVKTHANRKEKYYVISAEVPSTGPGRFPETFGILLDPENEIHMKYYMVKNSPD
jgi:PAS domain-containing protein